MIKFVLNILIRAIKVGLKLDTQIAQDVLCLPKKYVIKINVLPKNKSVTIKLENGKITKLKHWQYENVDLMVEFKDEKSAKEVLLGKTSLSTSFCEHRIKIYGSVNDAITLTRIVNLIECYLFPKFIYSKLFTPQPKMEENKLKFYLTFLFGGKLWNILNSQTTLKFALAKMHL